MIALSSKEYRLLFLHYASADSQANGSTVLFRCNQLHFGAHCAATAICGDATSGQSATFVVCFHLSVASSALGLDKTEVFFTVLVDCKLLVGCKLLIGGL